MTVQEAAGNSSVVFKSNMKEPSSTTTIRKFQTIGTLKKSSRTCDRNCVSVLIHTMRRPTC